jgi:hypothetical protein
MAGSGARSWATSWAQGCTLHQRGCNLSNAMDKIYVCYDIQNLVTIMHREGKTKLIDNLEFPCYQKFLVGYA